MGLIKPEPAVPPQRPPHYAFIKHLQTTGLAPILLLLT